MRGGTEDGRWPDEVKRRSDLQRPFLLDGELNDQTLSSNVTFIRSSPESTSRQRVNGLLPITFVHRTGDRIEVTLTVDDLHGESVTLGTAKRALGHRQARKLHCIDKPRQPSLCRLHARLDTRGPKVVESRWGRQLRTIPVAPILRLNLPSITAGAFQVG
jgi:hypothetical protein